MRRMARRIIRGAKSRIAWSVIRAANLVLPYLPVRVVFNIVILAQMLQLRGQRILLLHLISATAARPKHEPEFTLLSKGKKWMPVASSHVLHALGRHEDAVTAI